MSGLDTTVDNTSSIQACSPDELNEQGSACSHAGIRLLEQPCRLGYSPSLSGAALVDPASIGCLSLKFEKRGRGRPL